MLEKGGYAVIRQNYDIRGNVTEKRTYGPQRQPISTDYGCPIWRAQFDDQSHRFTSEELTPYAKAQLKKARENRLQGKGSPLFTDNKELIKKDPKKYKHIDTMTEWLNEQGV